MTTFALLFAFLWLLTCHNTRSVLSETASDFSTLDAWIADNADANLGRLIEFLSIPSVSSDPTRNHEVRRAADWLFADLKSVGMENVKLLETNKHPAVYADWLHAESAPTILIYGHFDVQPEDPVDLWTTPPFTPTVRDGKLFARGASDDKGHMYVPVAAIRAYLETSGSLPVNVKVLFEGEEEIGSPNLQKLLKDYKDMLVADYAFSADGGQISPEIPGLCLGLRGVMSMEVSVKVADVDMHSGTFGGGVRNPIHALARLLDSLRDPVTEQLLVDGFYDDVDEVSEEERKDIRAFPVPAEVYLRKVGVNESVGEKGLSFYERTWTRPSIEVVGIWGGFQGKGVKTVLPREAHAKLSCRLVSNQDVPKSAGQLREHLELEAGKMAGVSVSIKTFSFEGTAFKMDKRSGANAMASKVLNEVYGREPAYFRMGGSIPVLGYFREILGVETTMFAFAHADENVHAPDEYGRIDSFRRGERAYVRLFREIATAGGGGKDEL